MNLRWLSAGDIKILDKISMNTKKLSLEVLQILKNVD
jgi:hypothetical protein